MLLISVPFDTRRARVWVLLTNDERTLSSGNLKLTKYSLLIAKKLDEKVHLLGGVDYKVITLLVKGSHFRH